MGKYLRYPEYKDSNVMGLLSIPSHWIEMQLKRTVEGCVNGIWGAEPQNDGSDTIVIRVADFDRPKLSLQEAGFTYRKIEDKEKLTRSLKRGDLLLEKSGGGEKTLVGQVVLFEKDFDAVTSNFVAKMTPKTDFNSHFLKYVFSRFYSGNINYCSIKQNTGIQNLDSAAYLAEKFGFPPKEEQEKIANFLDHETAKIDTLIEKQKQLIKLLKEKRHAVISHAVTKGLNPNAPMRDSGIEWLGEVPEHWERIKLKHITRAIIDAEHKTAEYFDDGEFLVCRTTNVRDGKLRLYGGKWTNLETFTEWTKRGIPQAGDILFTREAPAGEACVYSGEIPLCLGQRMVLFKLKTERVDPHFVLHSIYSGLSDDFVKQLSQGSTVVHFNMSDIQNIPLFGPPIEEQIAITEYLAKVLSKYDELVKSAVNTIHLLQERRTALVSAAVTGKIDVRNWQESNR